MFKFLTPGFALLKVIPLRYWLAIVLVIVSTVAYAEWLHKDRVAQFKAGQHERQVLWDAQNKTQAEDALQRAISNAQEGKRRTERQEENQHAKDAQLAVARADAVRSDDARARMQQRASKIAAAAGCTGPLDTALACVRKAAAQVADALGRCGARVQQLALDTDDARARGFQCQRDYDALTANPGSSSSSSQPLKEAP
jgi:hypothetical protein